MTISEREELLGIIEKNSRLSAADIAAMMGKDEQEVADEITALEKAKVICGYHTVINWDAFEGSDKVTAMIGVKISPVRGEGFDRIATRISRFEEVDSVHLMSGSTSIEGTSMKDISHFVYEKIAPMESVVSTATYFVLKKYKDHNVIFQSEKENDERIQIMP